MTATTYEDALAALAEERESLVVLTAENRAAIRGLPERLGPRFIDVGICEQTMIGVAAGLALRGRTPVVHALASFLTMRAFEFIRTDLGIPGLPVTLVGYIPGLLSEANGPTHQALEDVSLMRGIPGMGVFCPADLGELVEALPAIVASPGPWYLRYTQAPAAVDHTTPFAPGLAELLFEGADVAILTYGPLLAEALRARELLEAKGLTVRLANMRTLRPVDEEEVLCAALSARLLVTIEDHFLTGGLATVVSEVLTRHGVATRLLALGLDDRWFKPALLPDVLAQEGLTGPRIAERICRGLARTPFANERGTPCPTE